jgi:hypothetical protein
VPYRNPAASLRAEFIFRMILLWHIWRYTEPGDL